MREYYLPPVIEKNAKKGYRPPSKGEIIACIVSYLDSMAKKTGFIRKHPAEKVTRIVLLHYPVDLMCRGNECVLVDPVVGEVIDDPGLLAQLIFLLQHPSPSPYLEPSIEIEPLNPLEYSDDLFAREEILVPAPKTGSGRYYVPLIIAVFEGKDGIRTVIATPLYYLSDFPSKYHGIRSFDKIAKLVSRVPIDKEGLEEQAVLADWMLERGDTRKSLESGLARLKEKGVLNNREMNHILKKYVQLKSRG